MEDGGNNSYYLVPSLNLVDLVAAISGANLSSGASAALWTRNSNATNQKFLFVPTIITRIEEEENEAEGLSFSPNPFVQEIILRANGTIDYELYDFMGNVIERDEAIRNNGRSKSCLRYLHYKSKV